jgi:hypothetical protein
MQVIDEKPKRGQEKAKRKPQKMWMISLMLLVFGLLVFSVTLIGIETINKMRRTAILELTATRITQHNATAMAQMTVTHPLIRVPTFIVPTVDAFSAATTISIQQTSLAATQGILNTRQARVVATLTAAATSAP